MTMFPLFFLMPVLIAVAYTDLRYLRIPNFLGIVAIALFVLTAPFLTLGELGLRIVGATSVFCIGFVLFAIRLVGGGDVKFLSAFFLFIPSGTYALFAFNFSSSMLLGIMFVLALRATRFHQNLSLVAIETKGAFPMGISIALSGFAHPFWVAVLG